MRPARIGPAIIALLVLLCTSLAAQRGLNITLPNKPDSVKFMAMGDNGTGEHEQYELA